MIIYHFLWWNVGRSYKIWNTRFSFATPFISSWILLYPLEYLIISSWISYYILLNLLLYPPELVWAKCMHCPASYRMAAISKVVLGVWNFAYGFLAVGGDVWWLLWRHVRRKISSSFDGGLSGGSSGRRPGSEDPHLR
jgi:hypothetical protein